MTEEDDRLVTNRGGINISNQTGDSSGLHLTQTDDDQKAAKKKKMIKYGLIGGAVAIVVILAIALPLALKSSSGGEEPFEPGPTPPGPSPPGPEPTPPPPDPPGPGPEPPLPVMPPVYNPYESSAFVNSESEIGGFIYCDHYEPKKIDAARYHMSQVLKATETKGNQSYATLLHDIPYGSNNQFVKNISYSFQLVNSKQALLTLTDASNKRYSIPSEVVNKPGRDQNMRMDMVGLQVFPGKSFAFQFSDTRNSSNWFIHTNASSLVFFDKFIQMDFQVPSFRMFGFGERVREFHLQQGTWTMWATGQDSPYDDGTGGKQVYGVHPFVLVQGRKRGDFFGMYFRNSNAQAPITRFNESTYSSTISYIALGGQLEIYFMLHGSARDIVSQYQNIIGKPQLPPFWSLGWGQASWAYDTQAQVEDVIAKYAEAKLPLETMWLDIPYLQNYADFSVNTKDFPDLKGLTKKLHDNRQTLVVILDAGLSADALDNKYYADAQKAGCLIQSSENKGGKYQGALVQHVWPEKTVFLDWDHPEAATIWQSGLTDLYAQVDYDGLWLDMNEPTGFCDGECPNYTPPKQGEEVDQIVKRQEEEKNITVPSTDWYYNFTDQTKQSTYKLPFIPWKDQTRNFDHMVLSLNATHPSRGQSEYDYHNLFGLQMCEQTHVYQIHGKANPNTDKRPFILTRSTFPGSGKFASHWLGDNWRDWSYMNYSIAGMMNMGMFGIPHVGADVCGFFGSGLEDQEMCARWIQLATFYPFARVHYNRTWNGKPLTGGNEPYNLKGDWLNIARNSIYDRYQYLRLMYTCLFEASVDGGSCIEPIFFYYPEDDKLFYNVEESFMVGGALKVSPILVKGVTEQKPYATYFPAGRWVSMTDFSSIVDSKGQVVQLKPQTTVNVHLRPGSLIPFQDNIAHTVSKTAELLEKPIAIIANRDIYGQSVGKVFLDTGALRSELQQEHYEHYRITVQANTMQKQLIKGTHASQNAQYFDKLVIVDAEDLAFTDFACMYNTHLEVINMTYTYDKDKKTLTIQPLQTEDPIKFHQFRQINFGSYGKKQDVNLCDPYSYQYTIKDGKLPDLTKPNATFILQHATNSLQDLNITLRVLEAHVLNVKWTFARVAAGQRKPFEVPDEIISPASDRLASKLSDYVIVTNKPYFQLQIINHQENTVLTVKELLLDSYLNYIYSELKTTSGDDFKGIMGLGDRVQRESLFYKDGVYSMWNLDYGTPEDDGRPVGKNVYGTHPFYMYKSSEDSWVGVFTNLAAAQDWYVKNNMLEGRVDVTSIAVGGVADIYYILDTTPTGILNTYLDIVGKPVLIPQKALGWHQCRWGYQTTQHMRDMVASYSANNLPLDYAWNDIDYMFNYRDFTYDHQRFPDLHEFVDNLHTKNISYIPILDAGIAVRSPGTYPAFDFGVDENIFVKVNSKQDQIAVAQVWPKDAAFPDFFSPAAKSWWMQELDVLHKNISFDGLWLDMNEVSNFCGGVCYAEQNTPLKQKHRLPYTPTGRDLEFQSLPLDAYHSNGYAEVDVHSLFGTLQSGTTSYYLKYKLHVRPLIISRSSYAGFGKFGSRWLGDNKSNTQSMAQSVLGIMMSGVFGIPFVGADICGFEGNTNAELCARWYVVGSYQPFSRNHNTWNTRSQEPYAFIDEYYEPGVSYTDIMRDAMRRKYSLIRYYYSTLLRLSIHGGAPLYQPVFFEFPNDNMAYFDPVNNVMLGDSLKLSVLSNTTGQNQTNFYFPAGTWCDVYNERTPCFTSEGALMPFRTKAYDSYVHLREGKIVPLQDDLRIKRSNIMNVNQLQDFGVDLHILGRPDPVVDGAWLALGHYSNDDGKNVVQEGNYNTYEILAHSTVADNENKILITFKVLERADNFKNATDAECSAVNANDYLQKIQIYNAKASTAQGKFQVHVKFTNEELLVGEALYNDKTDRLVFDFNGQYCLSSIHIITLTQEQE